ncbi:MAG: hypothetical protein JSW11_13050 [Candidatus Heimdallarchaeota archaeon]|nr:MAG: hypothetical protein JSW11_13050 [Candidatus Heimdallarchaeota archaeon]
MSSDLEGWFNFPKPVKLLDISLIGYIVILVVATILYLAILDHTVQNLMPIFLTAILALITWNFRTQLLKTSDPNMHKRYFREWIVICICIIVFIGVILIVYPVTY